MKKPSDLMKRALQQSRNRPNWWNLTELPKVPEEAFTYQKFLLGAADALTGADPRVIHATIGESFTWTTDKDGDAIEMLGVGDDGLPMYSGKLNEEQKARWKRITG